MDLSQGGPSECRRLFPVVCGQPDTEPASELRKEQGGHRSGGLCYRTISGDRRGGDAGGFADPLTGEGIYGALVSGQAAAKAILGELRGKSTAAETFAGHLTAYRQTLRFSSRAAAAFYANPARGFRAMRLPFVRRSLVKTYTHGLNVKSLAMRIALAHC